MTPNNVQSRDHELTSYAINRSGVVSEVIDGEAVIINLDSGRDYSINESGSVVWGLLLSQSMDIPGLMLKLGERYELPPDIERVLESALGQWISEGLLKRSEFVPGKPTDRLKTLTTELQTFTPPHLDIHTDMQDFLLVDPIHEVDDKGHAAPHRK